MVMKRGCFIGRVNSLLQEFHNISPKLQIQLINSFATSLYGSSLWDLYSVECEKLFKTWNTTIRNVLKIYWATHRQFIETLSEFPHLKVALLSWYINFYHSLKTCPQFSIRYLTQIMNNNKQSHMRKTLNLIVRKLTFYRIVLTTKANMVKSRIKYPCLLENEE